MNGARQDYHWLDMSTPALNHSQLLDMLNVRYVVVTATLPEPPSIAYYGKEVYRDSLTVIWENPNVFPRAWIVPDVYDNNDGTGCCSIVG
jgi:hypothetical protein